MFFLLVDVEVWECLGREGGSFKSQSISQAGLGIWKGRNHTQLNKKTGEKTRETGNNQKIKKSKKRWVLFWTS